MIISEQEYTGFIKPLIDKCITIGKALTEQEFAIIGDKIIKIVENEFNADNLLEILTSLSPLSIAICKKYELYSAIEQTIDFLNSKKSS